MTKQVFSDFMKPSKLTASLRDHKQYTHNHVFGKQKAFLTISCFVIFYSILQVRTNVSFLGFFFRSYHVYEIILHAFKRPFQSTKNHFYPLANTRHIIGEV